MLWKTYPAVPFLWKLADGIDRRHVRKANDAWFDYLDSRGEPKPCHAPLVYPRGNVVEFPVSRRHRRNRG
jgi:hypothetical protein